MLNNLSRSPAAASPTPSQSHEATTSGSRSPPPPLPPRNSGSRSPPFLPGLYPTLKRDNSFGSSSSISVSNATAAVPSTSHTIANSYARPSATLDRRKTTSTRLYEVVTERRTVDPELLEFYYMVKELRMRYLHNDKHTNPGHIIASEFNYHYPLETSIKILVHPALKALLSTADLTRTQGQVKGYGVPVVFTCDSECDLFTILLFS